jgi:hypothetical protein
LRALSLRLAPATKPSGLASSAAWTQGAIVAAIAMNNGLRVEVTFTGKKLLG